MNISKSAFMTSLDCYKKLWLDKHRTDTLPSKNNANNSQLRTGNIVGELARGLFAGGELVDFELGFAQMLEQTTELLQRETIIYEATLSGGGGFAMIDILVKSDKDNKWDIYEVKSSTKVKSEYILDSAYQRVVAEQNIEVDKNYLVHINNQYQRDGNLDGDLDIHQLFTIENITEKVAEISQNLDIKNRINKVQKLLRDDEPETAIDTHCLSCEY